VEAPRRAARPLPDFTKWGEVERKPMSNIRRKTAEHLANAWNVIPHVTQHDRADITAVEGLRKRYAPQAEKVGGKLTMTAIALKIVAGALQRFPAVQQLARRREERDRLQEVDSTSASPPIPRAVLLVPVVRDVDRKGIFELAKGPLAGPLGQVARRQARPRRDAGRRLHYHQPRRHRRDVLHPDRQLARGGNTRRLTGVVGTHLASCQRRR
jgi:pyruvate dehydrogenase E2 component (dihydrolipoamide acetyltransferase)